MMRKRTSHARNVMLVVGLMLLLGLLAAPAVQAFEGRGGDVVTIEANEVVEDDLYVAAGEFTLDGTVEGDLVAAGSTLTINGTVEGDLIAAGQHVIINGTVGDDVRIAGYAMTIGGDIADDIIGVGFSLEGEDESRAGGDLIYMGYQALLNGEIDGEANIAGGAVEIAGTIGGDATIDVGGTDPDEDLPPGFPFFPMLPSVPSVPASLTIRDSASIGGDLDYTANVKASVPGDAVAGEIAFREYIPEEPEAEAEKAPAPTAAMVVGKWFLRQARRLTAFLLIGVLMMWAVPDWTRKLARNVETKPLPSLGWGAVSIAAFGVAMITLVIATIVLAVIFGVVTLGELVGRVVALGGIVASSAGFGFSLLWQYVTSIVISVLLGQLIFRLFKSPAEDNRWWPMVLGVVIFVIITAIPVLGWLAKLAAVLLGLGALWIWGRDWLRRTRQTTSPPADTEEPRFHPQAG
jgi:hypothetical protein